MKPRYPLLTQQDKEILKKCETLETLPLSSFDREQVVFIKTQLEEDWRTPLEKRLNFFLQKYKT